MLEPFSCTRYLSCVILLATVQCVSVQGASTIKIFTGKNAESLSPDVYRFFRTCDLEVSRILPRRKSDEGHIEYSIIAVGGGRLKAKHKISSTVTNKVRIYLSDEIDDFKSDNALLAKLAALIVLKRTAATSKKTYRSIPEWIVYGVLRKVLRHMRRRRISGMVVYPGIHALILAGDAPDLMTTIEHPPSPEDGPSFKLAMEVCEITLNSVLRLPKGKNLLEDIINLSLKGVPPTSSFRGALSEAILSLKPSGSAKRDAFDAWLQNTALRSAVNIFNPLDATSAERIFREYCKVRYATKPFTTPAGVERPSEIRCRLLSDIAEELNKMKNPKLVMMLKQRDLALLRLMLPGDLQSAVDKIRTTLSLLDHKKTNEFKTRYAAAELEFYDALEKRQKIESFVGKIERDRVPPSLLYAPQLSEIDEYARNRRLLWPQLHSYLDSEEKNVDR